MDAREFFLDQYDFIRTVVDSLILGGLTDDQLRHHPAESQNSLAWLLWHATRWEDVVVNSWVAGEPQVLDECEWLDRVGLASREVGTAMTAGDAAALSARIDLAALGAYRQRVGQRTRETVAALRPGALAAVVDEGRLRAAIRDGAHGNARAPWLDEFFAGRTVAWFLAFLNVHDAEHLIGEALAIRGQAGLALGL